eukprot:gene41329-65387_t
MSEETKDVQETVVETKVAKTAATKKKLSDYGAEGVNDFDWASLGGYNAETK